MSDRKTLAKVFVDQYRNASKLEKGFILNEFIDYTGFNRHYAARVLRDAIMGWTKISNQRKHDSTYGHDVKLILTKLWGITDYICGKRLVAIIPELISKREQFHEFEIPEDIKVKLKKISASTIDRLLKPDRNNLGRKGTSMTKGTRYLIDRIPVKLLENGKILQQALHNLIWSPTMVVMFSGVFYILLIQQTYTHQSKRKGNKKFHRSYEW